MKPYCQRLVAFIVVTIIFGAAPGLRAQQSSPGFTTNYGNTRWFPSFWGPYATPDVPAPPMTNSELLESLLSDGTLRLSVQDVVSLALENNLDIAVARYNVAFSRTDVLRTQGGGAARGFSGSFQSGALFSGAVGSGVSGAGGGASGGVGGAYGSASAIQMSGGTFDPTAFVSFGWNQNTTPLGTTIVTGVPYEYNQGTSYEAGIQQLFQTGTSYTIFAFGQRGTNNSLTSVFDPFVSTTLGIGFTQPLLNGFGRRANSTQIRIAKNDAKVADSVFRQQVITTIAQVVNDYWDYLSDKEQVGVAQQAVAYSQKLLADNKRQVEIGTLAPIEVVRAESELASDQQKLIVAQTNLQQQAELIKTALAKRVEGPLATAQVDALDKLPEPRTDDIPPVEEALQLAFANRPEIEQTDLKLRDQDYTIERGRNALLPSLNLFATYLNSGLSGHQAICPPDSIPFALGCETTTAGGTTTVAPPVGTAVNGLSQSFTQNLHGEYPNYSLGLNLSIPIRNRSAQADAARALLERRQMETQLQQSKNNIAQQVRTAVIGVIQARAQVEAARKATILARETLDAEQKKFRLGESTVFMVIQEQRDLSTAEGNEVTARSTYAKALTSYQQQTGTILKDYNVELTDALSGHATKVPNIPGSAETPAPQVLNPGPTSNR